MCRMGLRLISGNIDGFGVMFMFSNFKISDLMNGNV